jgi:two-component system LytT family response regulator
MTTASPARMTCVVIDDEEMARRKLRSLLEKASWLACVGEAADGPRAVQLIDQTRPDLAFLDIRMPGLSGLQVLERVKHIPRVIFTTAFDEFAVAAFEIRALDYLLKPFSASRLRLALDRAREVVAAPPALIERASAALRHDVPRQVFVRTGGTLLALAVESIERIDGSDDYSSVWANGRAYLLYRRLAEFAELLAPAGFLRVHRSHIVNTAHIVSARAGEGGRLELRLRSGAVVTVSRSRAASVRDALRPGVRVN